MTKKNGKKVVIKGTARGIKVGLEVDGVWLIDLSIDQEKKYVNKLVEVTGYVEEAPELVVKEYEDGKPVSQGVEGKPPLVMKNIISIKILEK